MNGERRGQGIIFFFAAAVFALVALASCGGSGGSGGSGGGDWYYHWNCNGDYECLTTNPTGQPIGSSDEGPVQAACTQILQFDAINWGPAAFYTCDQSSTVPATLMSLVVTPAGATLPIGLTQQYTATAYYFDGTTKDVTSQAAWAATTGGPHALGTPVIATISASGLATAVSVGSITIEATYGGMSGSATLYVSSVALESITVAPSNPTIAAGLTQQFTATGHYSDGTTKTLTNAYWSSGTTAVATINSSSGLAAGVSAGTSTITASAGSASGNTTLAVTAATLQSITVTPTSPSVHAGFGLQFTATGTFSDGTVRDVTTMVAWTSGTPTVAIVNGGGLATGVAAGTSTITAATGGISASTMLTVTNATLQSITVTPASPSIAPGWTVQFTAVGNFSDSTSQVLPTGVAWASGTPSVATITANGLAAGIAPGTSAITATYGSVSGSTVLTVTSTPPGVNWTTEAPLTSSAVAYILRAVAWSGSQFVAVGYNGTVPGTYNILTSPDGVTWTSRNSGSSATLYGVAWSGAQFAAVGDYGYILTSPDGITWTSRASGTGNALFGVTWSGTQFVAVGVSGTILTSPDGFTWTPETSGNRNDLRSVTWSGNEYVAVGNVTLISPDGVKWTATDSYAGWMGVASSASQVVKVGQYGNISTSPDGVIWTAQTTQPTSLYGVIWTGTEFVAVGGGGTGYIITSRDGVTWTSQTPGTSAILYGQSATLYGVAWSGSRLVAVGTSGYIVTSP